MEETQPAWFPFSTDDLDGQRTAQPPVDERGKYTIFHVRVNDVTDEELEAWKEMAKVHCRELTIGTLEIGRVHGRKHYHCHVHFMCQKTIYAVRKLMIPNEPPRMPGKDYWIGISLHYTNSEYTIEDNRNYCTKEGILYSYTRPDSRRKRSAEEADLSKEFNEAEQNLIEEFKTLPEKEDNMLLRTIEGYPKKVRHAIAAKVLGVNKKDGVIVMYEQIHRRYGANTAKAFFTETYHSTAGLSVRKAYPSTNTEVVYPKASEQEVWWITGGAGTGKTTLLNLLYPGAYTKNKGTPYWESFNYKDHSIMNPHMAVIFNEMDTVSDLLQFSQNGKSFDAIKNILDVFPFPVEIKHSAQVTVRPRRVLITSNTTIDSLMTFTHLQSRHDQGISSNPIFGLDVSVLRNALLRRTKVINIRQLMDMVDCFCMPKMNNIDFGGVFACFLKDTIKEGLTNIVRTHFNDPFSLSKHVEEFRLDMEARTIDYLEKFRWQPMIHFPFIKTGMAPPEQHLLSEVQRLFMD